MKNQFYIVIKLISSRGTTIYEVLIKRFAAIRFIYIAHIHLPGLYDGQFMYNTHDDRIGTT
jgi:hypothetical protein